jgi:hypothetical protein
MEPLILSWSDFFRLLFEFLIAIGSLGFVCLLGSLIWVGFHGWCRRVEFEEKARDYRDKYARSDYQASRRSGPPL